MWSRHSCAVGILVVLLQPMGCLADLFGAAAPMDVDSTTGGVSKIHGLRDGSSLEMCEAGAISLAVEPGTTVTAGDVLWNFPASDVSNITAARLCDTCGYLPSYIINVSPSTAPCTPPAAEGCEVLDLQTRPAKFGEVFDLDFLQVIAAIVVTDEDSFGDLIRCKETSAAAPAAAGEEPLKSPEDCSAWNEVYPDTGVCKYTECCVEPGLTESPLCFLCDGDTCDNGCGTSGFQGQLVPDSLDGLFEFETGCCNHDHCWSSALERQDCDAAFYRDNIVACNTLHGDTMEDGPKLVSVVAPADLKSLTEVVLDGSNGTDATVCRMIGWMYFATVASAPGDKAHVETQAERAEYEMSGNCTCPTGVDASLAPTPSAPPPASDTVGTTTDSEDSTSQEASGDDVNAEVGSDASAAANTYIPTTVGIISGAAMMLCGLFW